MRAIVDSLGGRVVEYVVSDPAGRQVRASVAVSDLRSRRVALIESAQAAGLSLMRDRPDVRRASSRGVGELISAALDLEPERLMVCIGGTATNDGGSGMAQALGVRLMRANGSSIGFGGEALLELDAIDLSGLDTRISSLEIEACVDVDNPLTGGSGASAVFGPQKGASPTDVRTLDRALGRLASVVRDRLGLDLERVPGAGAGGGLGFGVMAFLGGRLTSGTGFVADAVDLEGRIRKADVAITGEGRFDGSSLRGKAPSLVLRLARTHDVKTVVVCGDVDPGMDRRAVGATRIVSAIEHFGHDRALNDPLRSVKLIAAELAGSVDRL